jgi:hypothetical protein
MLAAVLVAFLLAGCGSSHKSAGDVDPAGAVPASVPLYAGAIVRPEGALKTSAQAAGKALTHQPDPYLRLLETLRTPGSPPLDFQQDFASWLGPQAGVFASSLGASASLLAPLEQTLLGGSTSGAFPFSANGLQGAIVMDTTDAGKARSFLESQARLAGAHPASYRGTSFQVTAGGIAFGIVSSFAVIGSEAGLHDVVDTTLGGPALVHQSDYSKLLGVAPAGTLAHVYSNPGAASGSAAHGSAGEPAGLLALLAGSRTVNVSLVPSSASISLDADALASASGTDSGGLLSSSAEGAHALSELPGSSWLAVGLGKVGTTLAGDVQGLGSLASLGTAGSQGSEEGSAGFTFKGLLEGILAPLKVLGEDNAEARRAFQSWMGSAGLFASGSGLVELRAGVAINSNNPALSRAAVTTVGEDLRKQGGSVQPVSIPGTDAAISVRVAGLPVELAIANGRASDGQTKFVIGLAEASVGAALNPTSTLASGPTRSAAATALGEGIEPSLIVNFPMLLSLLEGVGLSEEPSISKVVPYLRASTTLAGGAKSLGGEVERLRLVLGLTPAG